MNYDERSARRQELFKIIQMILNGEIDSSKTPLAKIFHQNSPREEYISPKDRAGYNYVYTTNYTGEIPFVSKDK